MKIKTAELLKVRLPMGINLRHATRPFLNFNSPTTCPLSVRLTKKFEFSRNILRIHRL